MAVTDAQLRRLAKQLHAGADGFATLSLAVGRAVTGDGPAVRAALENMERLHRELSEQAAMVEDPPQWLRQVKL